MFLHHSHVLRMQRQNLIINRPYHFLLQAVFFVCFCSYGGLTGISMCDSCWLSDDKINCLRVYEYENYPIVVVWSHATVLVLQFFVLK
ncbi:hypothetical protein BC937DRAFT_89907 [Endogone sp. FLAS-F59071]|nr:hypothetical protein BC937DRAFT_89907 [Endogone sp. FLAS-F59071]|eukprot:RUS17498.1 hypothetical protein BC937DRAFT_89907 [Endogone sp. FLAS-F59071]